MRNHEFMPITLQMMEGKCINPIKDIAFKKLFSVEKFLVSLLNCNFALKHNEENNDKYYYSYKLREEGCLHDVLTNALNVIILELPKFENLSSECDTLLKKWLFLRFFRNLVEKSNSQKAISLHTLSIWSSMLV